MNEPLRELSADAKLVRVVLDNCGPLAAPEAAQEAYLCVERARSGLAELASAGLVEPVCGMCEEREEVYALTETGERAGSSA
jgi:hypothetical protein